MSVSLVAAALGSLLHVMPAQLVGGAGGPHHGAATTSAPAAGDGDEETPGTAVGPPQPGGDPDAVAVRLAEARIRWLRELDAAGWDRDAPAARTAADALTVDLLPLLARTDDARREVVDLLAELAADALGPFLRGEPAPDVRLLRAYLSRHDDAALAHALLEPPGAGGAGSNVAVTEALDLARAHRAAAAPVLASAVGTLRGYDRESVCAGALRLPSGPRTTVAVQLASTWGAEAPEDLGPSCAVLGAMTRDGRARLAAWLARAEATGALRGGLGPSFWSGAAVFALAGTEQHAAAERVAAPLLTGAGAPPVGSYYWAQFAEPVALLLPHLTVRTPFARTALARLAAMLPREIRWTALARLRAGDTGAVAEALEALRNPHGYEPALHAALGVVGLAAGLTDVALAREARARLTSLRAQLRAFGINEPSSATIDAWVAGIDRVAACRASRACLVDLLANGSDAAAARALVALGRAGASRLTAPEARPLLRRIAVQPDAWLLTAFAITVEGCPRALRGAREAIAVRPRDEAGTVVAPYLQEFARVCAEPGSAPP